MISLLMPKKQRWNPIVPIFEAFKNIYLDCGNPAWKSFFFKFGDLNLIYYLELSSNGK